jgi:uncharacterized protein YebE (UPF0316 family)
MSDREVNNHFINVCKNFAIIVTPVGIATGAVQMYFQNRHYTAVAALFSGITVYLLYLELRMRNLENKRNGKKG